MPTNFAVCISTSSMAGNAGAYREKCRIFSLTDGQISITVSVCVCVGIERKHNLKVCLCFGWLSAVFHPADGALIFILKIIMSSYGACMPSHTCSSLACIVYSYMYYMLFINSLHLIFNFFFFEQKPERMCQRLQQKKNRRKIGKVPNLDTWLWHSIFWKYALRGDVRIYGFFSFAWIQIPKSNNSSNNLGIKLCVCAALCRVWQR